MKIFATLVKKCSSAAVKTPCRHCSPTCSASGATTNLNSPKSPSVTWASCNADSNPRVSKSETASRHFRRKGSPISLRISRGAREERDSLAPSFSGREYSVGASGFTNAAGEEERISNNLTLLSLAIFPIPWPSFETSASKLRRRMSASEYNRCLPEERDGAIA